MIEKTKVEYTEKNYGNGSPPSKKTYIVLETDGIGLFAEKLYPVVSHRAYAYVIRNEYGHEKVFPMYSGLHAHVLVYDEINPPWYKVYEAE